MKSQVQERGPVPSVYAVSSTGINPSGTSLSLSLPPPLSLCLALSLSLALARARFLSLDVARHTTLPVR
jgi:hypothetical protein